MRGRLELAVPRALGASSKWGLECGEPGCIELAVMGFFELGNIGCLGTGPSSPGTRARKPLIS